MRRILFFTSLAAALIVAGCAPVLKSPVRNPSVAKCYVVDSTRHVSREEHARIFEGVESEGGAFPPCDSASPETIRIRPEYSGIASLKTSYIILGADLATAGAGFGLAFAQENILWLLLSSLQFQPTASLSYRAEYTDNKGKKQQEDIPVSVDAWFKSREESKALLLEQSRRDLSTVLFGKEYPVEKPKRTGRVALDIPPLIFSGSNGGLWVDAHFEKYLPGNFTFDLSPGGFFPFSKPDHVYSVYAGPRRYFFGDHSGLFLGVEPYLEVEKYYGRSYSRVALPITFGFVSQGKRIVTGLDFGIGPSYILAGAYKRSDYLVLGSLYVGFAF